MISSLLLRVSVTLLLIGMVFGIVMGIRQDFSLAPAHAHLNLVGFVVMFAAGLYYRIIPEAAESLLAKTQAALHIVGSVVFPIGIAVTLIKGPGHEAGAIIGSLIVLAATVLFAIVVFRTTALARAPMPLPRRA